MSDTPEDRFNRQVWEVLQDLKEEHLATPKDQLISYKRPNVVGVGIIPWPRKVQIIQKLQEWGALKIVYGQSVSEKYGLEYQSLSTTVLEFRIIQPKFDGMYQKFARKLSPRDEPSEESETDTERLLSGAPVNIVVADLESLYEEITEEKNRVQYFIKVAQYGKYIQDNKASSQILSNLYKDAKEDADLYLKAWEKFVKVWKEYAKDLLKKAEEAGIKDEGPLSNEISSITAKLQETETSIWETDLSYFYRPYQTLIWKFKNVGKAKLLVPKHVEATEDGMIVIYPYYVEASSAWDKFRYSREAKPWWAHYQICRLAVGVLGTKEKRQYFKRDSIIDSFYKFEFDEVAKGNINRSPIVLHQDKYEVWIKRLHKYLIPRLQNSALTAMQTEELDYSDTAARKALEKKWDVLQAIWDVYESHSRPDSILMPIDRLVIKDRSEQFIDGVVEGLKNEGLFEKWDKKERYYDIQKIEHKVLSSFYEELGTNYKKYAKNYQSRKEDEPDDSVDKFNFLLTPPQYDEKKRGIVSDGKFCKLPPFKKEDSLAKVIFNIPIGEFRDWSEVYEIAEGSDDFEGKSKSFYDTCNRLNKRLQKFFNTDQTLITRESKSIKRNF